jgi:serine protease Do
MSEQFNENEPKDMMGNGRGENHNSRKMNRKRNVAGIVASALLFGCVAGGSMAGINAAASHLWNINQTTAGAAVAGTQAASQTAQSSTAQNNNSGTVTLAKSNAADKKSVSQIVKDAMPSVVSITNMVQYRQNGFSIFGDQGETGTAAASGSGIIVGKNDDELLIATNNHVVSDSTSLSVQFVDGESVDAKIKGTDADADLAVIAVDLKNMKSSTLD